MPYLITIVVTVLVALALGHIVRSVRTYDKREWQKLLSHLGWVATLIGIAWVVLSLAEQAKHLILSSYTNFGYLAFSIPFIIATMLFATSSGMRLRSWHRSRLDSAALPPLETSTGAQYGRMPEHLQR